MTGQIYQWTTSTSRVTVNGSFSAQNFKFLTAQKSGLIENFYKDSFISDRVHSVGFLKCFDRSNKLVSSETFLNKYNL